MHQRGPALVRIALFSLLFGAFALALVQPVQAGTEAAPEIQDPANDQELLDTIPISTQPPGGVTSVGLNSDLIAGWVEEISATTLQFTVDVQGNAAPTSSSTTTWNFHFEIGGQGYDATATQAVSNANSGVPGNGQTTPGGVAATAVAGAGIIVMTVEKSAIGNPAGGTVLTNLFMTAQGRFAGQVPNFVTDRAPNSGAGQDYVLPGGSGNTTVPGDSDGDGLNDTCETEFFGDLNGTNNATEDPDNDGLTNGQECAGNPRTDPTKADTDGDGTNDDQDPAPTDPAVGGTSGSQTSTSTSRSSTSGSGTGSTTSSSRTTTSGDSDGADGAGDVKNLSDAVEKLQSDMGYLGTSAGGMVAVLLLAILALAVRWSL